MIVKKSNTKKKLEELGTEMVQEIKSGEGPTFETTLRTKSNTLFDETIGCLRTGNKKETRRFLSVSQARTFMQTVAIATKTRQFLAEDLHTSIRGLFYQLKFSLGENLDEDLFSEQSESNQLIEDLEAALRIKREDLNLTTDRKGFVAGPMVIKDRFGGEETTIDCAKQGRSGWSIPSDVDNDMELESVVADYVLVVEKDALWQRLNEDKFWKKENCLVITPKGQSTRGTRRLLRKLADRKLPIFAFSIDGEEPFIRIDEDGLIRNERIEDYCQKQFNKFGSIETPAYEKGIAGGASLEVDKDGEQMMGKILNVVRHPITESLFEVKTKNGFSIKVTGSHSVMVFDDYKIVPKMVSELKEGDLLVAPTNVPNNEKLKEIELISLAELEAPEFLQNIEIIKPVKRRKAAPYRSLSEAEKKNLNKNCKIRWGKSGLQYGNKIEITKEFARLLGYYVAEGHADSGGVGLTFGSKEKRYIKDAIKCIEKTFGCHVHVQSSHPSSTQLKFGGKLLAVAFEKLFKCGKGAISKAVPFIILNAPKKIKYEFLRGYFRGDGCARVTSKGGRLWGVTISRKLASDLVLLLMQLNCYATIEIKKDRHKGTGKFYHDKYHVFISNKKSLRILKSIALDIRGDQRIRIAEYIDRADVEKSPVYCSIPTTLVKPVQEMVYRFSGHGISDLFSQKTISLEKLEQLLTTLKKELVLKRDVVIETLRERPWSSTTELTELTGFKFITVYKSLKRAEKKGRVKSKLKKGDRIWLVTEKKGIYEESTRKIDILSNLARNKIALVPVRSINKVKASGGLVYDVEVNPTHTFVGGVGPLLLHNTDCDAWGWYIYWTIKTGSMNLAYLGGDFAVPEAKFIGVTMSDIKEFPFLEKLTIKAKDVDVKRAEEMLGYPWINRHTDWVRELKLVLKTKKKLEQDALQGQRLTFVGEYLKQKIENKEWLA